jgi:hypothetical protein
MRIFILALVFAFATPAFAQVNIQISFPAPPPLVVVSPGVQVVPDYEHEVFFVGGLYFARIGTVWYQSPDFRGGWIVAPAPKVPVALVKIPPGHYKKWKGNKGSRGNGNGQPGGKNKAEKGNKAKGKKK